MSRRLLQMLAAIALFVAVAQSAAAEDSLEDLLRQGVETIGAGIDGSLVVSFGNFTYADKQIGSRFSIYLEDQLSLVLADSDRFEVLDRKSLEQVLEAMELSLSDLVDPESAVPAGRLKGVQAIFSGRFFDTEDAVLVYLGLTSVETGTALGVVEISLPRALIPPPITVVPDNYNDALYVLEELAQVADAPDTDFRVKVWTKRGNGGTYFEGEELAIHFFSNRDCYIKIYHIDVDKNISLIFPNHIYGSNFIRGQKLHTIPDAHYGFSFELGAPFGTEFIKVVASTAQFEDIEEAFQGLGSTSKELVQRGLSVKQKEQQITEAIISYTILAE